MADMLSGLGRWLRGEKRPQAFELIEDGEQPLPPPPVEEHRPPLPDVVTLPREALPPRRAATSSSQAQTPHLQLQAQTASPTVHGEAIATLQQLHTKTYQDVAYLARQLSARLDDHAQQNDQVADALSAVASAVENLPRIQEDRAQLYQALHEHFGEESRRNETLSDLLAHLDRAATAQADALGSLAVQVEAAHKLNQDTAATLEAVRQSLTGIGAAHAQSADVMRELAGTTLEQRDEFTYAIERHSRLLIIVVLTCGALSIGAIILTLATLVKMRGQ